MASTDERISPHALLALLKGRRSIRRYRPDPVPDEMIEQLLEAGRWAPSASNRQPWTFIVIQDKDILQQVAQHAAYYFIRWAHVRDAPLLIALCGDARHPIYRQFLHEDVGLAGSQIMLQAKALGLGTCWLGGLDRKAIAGILRVPNHVEVIGLLSVGFPDEEPEPRSRKPLSEIVYYNVYGNRGDDGDARPGQVPGGLLGKLLRRLRINI
jgi:nitroreductase